MCILNDLAFLSTLKDVVVTAAAAVGIWVAIRGLNTWSRQLKGGIEYDLTRRILKCTYRLREAIKVVRNPILLNNELPSPPEDKTKEMSKNQMWFYGLSEAYQARWSKVFAVRSDLHTELLEAEVLWGSQIHGIFDALFRLQQELFADSRSYLKVCNPNLSDELRQAAANSRSKRREVLYDESGETEDEFTKEVSAAIENIEKFLKPHLQK